MPPLTLEEEGIKTVVPAVEADAIIDQLTANKRIDWLRRELVWRVITDHGLDMDTLWPPGNDYATAVPTGH